VTKAENPPEEIPVTVHITDVTGGESQYTTTVPSDMDLENLANATSDPPTTTVTITPNIEE